MKNRIRVFRAEKRWSQEKLGDIVGVSRQAIHAIENGKHEPSLRLAWQIAAAFGEPIEAVFQVETDINTDIINED